MNKEDGDPFQMTDPVSWANMAACRLIFNKSHGGLFRARPKLYIAKTSRLGYSAMLASARNRWKYMKIMKNTSVIGCFDPLRLTISISLVWRKRAVGVFGRE